MDTTSPRESTTKKWLVPAASTVASAPNRATVLPGGSPATGAAAARSRGLIERDIENARLAADSEAGPLDDLIGHSITYRISAPAIGSCWPDPDVHDANRLGQGRRVESTDRWNGHRAGARGVTVNPVAGSSSAGTGRSPASTTIDAYRLHAVTTTTGQGH
jgi:hypothetical protein